MVPEIDIEYLKELNALDLRFVCYQRNERIFSEGQKEGFDAGMITDGLIYLLAENDRYEREILQILRAGDLFTVAMGTNLLQGTYYLAAKYPTKAVLFSWGSFLQLQGAAALLRRMQAAETARCDMLHRRGIRARLICFFRQEAQIQGTLSLHLPFPLTDLADYLAIERAAMAREIGKMKEEGLLFGERRNLALRGDLLE